MTIELRAADGGAVQVSPEILQAFRAGFRGPVLGPDAPEYEETRRIWNEHTRVPLASGRHGLPDVSNTR